MKRQLLTTLALGLGALAALGQGTHQFVWSEAQTRMSQAHSADGFSRAAEVYEQLTHAGVRNGALWYNLGTARLLGEDASGALQALLRAERYTGTTPEIARNIKRAIAASSGDDSEPGLPWYRVPLFWHFALPCPVRAGVLATAFSCLWIALALRFVGARRAAHSLAAVSAVALIMFGSSVAATLHAESVADRFEALRHQRLAAAETTGNSSADGGVTP